MTDLLTPDELAQSARLAAGLHRLADLVQEHPELGRQLHYPLTTVGLGIYPESSDTRAEVARFVRTMKAATHQPVTITTTNDTRRYLAHVGGIRVRMFVYREEVCRRVVVGVRHVTEDVPDPEALAAVPTVQRTRDEEVVEWHCDPVLAGDTDIPDSGDAPDSPSESAQAQTDTPTE